MRKSAFAALLSCVALFAASNASANTGVAFVHGTGSQTNAYNDYWQIRPTTSSSTATSISTCGTAAPPAAWPGN